MTQPESWWYDEAPSKGAKVSDWKYKFEINVINSGTAYPPLYKGGLDGRDRYAYAFKFRFRYFLCIFFSPPDRWNLSGSSTKGGEFRSLLMHLGPVEPLRVAPAELVV
jgi:hypothetical protein